MKRIQIGVMGPAKSEYPEEREKQKKIEQTAERIGELIAGNGMITFTGGCDGAMESTSKGAKNKNGMTVGVPGRGRGVSNKYVDVEILTDIDVGSFIFAGLLSCDAVIFIPGGAGTLAELCVAYRLQKPIIILTGFDKRYDNLIGKYLDKGKIVKSFGAETPEQAVELAIKLAKDKLSKSQIIKE